MSGTAYPPLSTLLSVGRITSELDFVGGAVDQLLANICYTDLVSEVSPDNDARFFSLTLVTEELAADLFGSGLKLIFFPAPILADDDLPPPLSEIPVAASYSWPILRFIPDFDLLTFASSAKAFFGLALALVEITEDELLEGVVACFISDPSPYTALINGLKTWDSGNGATPLSGLDAISIPVGYTAIEYIVAEAETQGVDLFEAVFAVFIDDITNLNQGIDNVGALLRTWVAGVDRADLEALLLPDFTVEIPSLSLAVEAPRTVLVPLDDDGLEIDDANWRATFTSGGVRYDSASGFQFSIDENLTIDLPPAVIPGFGLTLAFHDVKVDLSRTSNIAEATADGRGPDFMGVWAGSAVIGLPPRWFGVDAGQMVAIVGRNLLIGTGGLTGTIRLETLATNTAPGPTGTLADQPLTLTLGKAPSGTGPRKGFGVGFLSFEMKFRQNVLLESRVAGTLTVPRLITGPIGIELYFTRDGDFEGSATFSGGGHLFEVLNVFTFNATRISLGKADDHVFLRASGDLSFANNPVLGNLIKAPIHIEKLLIDSAGGISIEGGTIPLPESILLPLGPAKIAITAIHFGKASQIYGTTMRQYAYWGFDGGIDVSPGGLDCRGDGIKFYYTTDDDDPAGLHHHHFLRIEGIGIDMVIPFGSPKEEAALLISGYLALRDPVYQGKIGFILPKAKIAGGASMKYDTREPAWLVRAWLELPKALPLGSTGLGVFGFQGLFGLRYVADKGATTPPLTAEDTWSDYYRASPMGVSEGKFLKPVATKDASNPFSVGAGVSLATMSDDGKAFTSQLFLLVQLPPLIILDGKFDILADKRLGLTGDDDPPFYAFITLSEESIEIGAGANYLVPRGVGDILRLNVTLESAYFFHNASAWYVNVGTKDSPATARVIDMFDAYAYLMLSASGIEAGTGVRYDFQKSYGPLDVSAHAYLDLWAYVSFERTRAGGGIALGGYVDIRVFKVGLQISLATALTVELSTPFRIAGYVELCVTIDLKVKKFHKCADVHFVWDRNSTVDLEGVDLLQGDAFKVPASAVHMLSGETYAVEFSTSDSPSLDCYVPLDCYIDIKLTKPVTPKAGAANIGGFTSAPWGASEALPPRYADRAVDHAYSLESLTLQVHKSGGVWVDYHPYQALIGAPTTDGVVPDLTGLPIGVWQKQDPGYSQIRMLALTPFSFMQPGIDYSPEEWGVTPRSSYCVSQPRVEHCALWSEPSAYGPGTGGEINGLTFLVEGAEAAGVSLTDPRLAPYSLGLQPGGRLVLTFHEPIGACRIVAHTQAPQVVIRFQRRKPWVITQTPTPVSIPWPWGDPQYEDVEVRTVPRADLSADVLYPAAGAAQIPIERIVIEPPAPDAALVTSLENSLQNNYYQWLFAAPGNRPMIEVKRDKLRAQLDAEHARTCTGGGWGKGDSNTGGGDGSKDEIGALTEQLKAVESDIESKQSQYDKFCKTDHSGNGNDDGGGTGTDGTGEDPAAGDGCLGPIVRPIMTLLRRPPPPVAPSRVNLPPPPPPPPPGIDCAALAAEIAALEKRAEAIRTKLDALGSDSGSGTGKGGGVYGAPVGWDCATFVHEVCWLTVKDIAFNSAIPGLDAIEADYSNMKAAVTTMVAPVWRPEQQYRIKLHLRDTLTPKGAAVTERDFIRYIHFRTDGPLGYYSKYVRPPLLDTAMDPTRPDDKRDAAPELSLKFYIDPKSYPDPFGDLTYAKPVYWAGVSFDLFLAKPHAQHFFADWPDLYGLGARKFAMEIQVLDPAMAAALSNGLAREAPDVIAPKIGEQSWREDLSPRMTPELTAINTYSAPSPNGWEGGLTCLTIGGDPIKPAAFKMHTDMGDLRPDKLYTALVVNNRLDGNQATGTPTAVEVHRFPFRTSLYASFAEHIASSKLKDAAGNSRVAAFTIAHALAPGARAEALALVQALPTATTHADAYPDPFDRLIHAWLRLAPPPPPLGVEFNFITDTVTNETYGLWIRSREAINDPRLPASFVQAAIVLRQNLVAVSGVQTALVSKDGCEAFLMATSGSLPLTDLSVVFKFFKWNGTGYADVATAATDPFGRP